MVLFFFFFFFFFEDVPPLPPFSSLRDQLGLAGLLTSQGKESSVYDHFQDSFHHLSSGWRPEVMHRPPLRQKLSLETAPSFFLLEQRRVVEPEPRNQITFPPLPEFDPRGMPQRSLIWSPPYRNTPPPRTQWLSTLNALAAPV